MPNNVLGADFELIDEPVSPDVAKLTGRPHLLSTNGPASPVTTSRANTGNATVDAQLEVLLDGGCSEVVLQGYGASLPTLAQARALLPAGPGSVLAPEAVTSADLIICAASWGEGKVFLGNGPSGATTGALVTLAGAVKAGVDGRGTGLWADWITHALTVGTANVPATLGVAAAIARNDEASDGNTAKAAKGKNGVIKGGQSVVNGVRSVADVNTLATAQVNTVKVLGSEIRNNGYFTLADLTKLKHWWDLGGSRVVMDYRAKCAALSEDSDGDTIDGNGEALDRIKSLREGELERLHLVGALFGESPSKAFRVDVGPKLNPLSELQAGRVVVRTFLRTAPHITHVLDQTIRRPITATV